MLGDCLGVICFNNPAWRVRNSEFTEPWPIHDVDQGRGQRVGGLWAAVGPGGAGTGSGMEEWVGLSKAVGQAPSQLLPYQPVSLPSHDSWGSSCPEFRFLGRVLMSYLLGKAKLYPSWVWDPPQATAGPWQDCSDAGGENEGWGSLVGDPGDPDDKEEELAEREPRSPSESRRSTGPCPSWSSSLPIMVPLAAAWPCEPVCLI